MYTKREDWEPHVRKHTTTCKLPFFISFALLTTSCISSLMLTGGCTGYHASGTCAMGKPEDANAVLDSRLRVRGVRNLRVADVSSVPKVNNGHTQMVAYGIGEGAAEIIKEDARNGAVKGMADAKARMTESV
jgi:choline dehydrogenase-like flavoprotein